MHLEGSILSTGERLWQLPMQSSYWKAMESHIADMKNSGKHTYPAAKQWAYGKGGKGHREDALIVSIQR